MSQDEPEIDAALDQEKGGKEGGKGERISCRGLLLVVVVVLLPLLIPRLRLIEVLVLVFLCGQALLFLFFLSQEPEVDPALDQENGGKEGGKGGKNLL